jgi:Leucine-rich repeat (LRR) protein
MECENLITFNIEAIGSCKPIYTLSFENDKTINELYDQILYDLEYDGNIILYFNNEKINKSDIKLNNAFNEEEKEVRLDIECKEYTEREILEIFYYATNCPNWHKNTNWLTDKPLSEWYGIEIHENSNSKFIVKRIKFFLNNLTGEIPKEIGKLINLYNLCLDFNQLSGEIPKEICKLNNLQSLSLTGNELLGEIPKKIGNLINLEELNLSRNKLKGEIPKEIGKLINLQSLDLSHNQLLGEIPKEIGKLINLISLFLYDNELSGEIPKEIGKLTNLSFLWLHNNQLSGEIPNEILKLN